jgi:cysteine desulfurase
MAPIYLDHNATTPIAPEVADAMRPLLEEAWGNPSSQHEYGRAAKAALDEARAEVAALINAEPDEIVFTSGGSEANNLAIKGVLFHHHLDEGPHGLMGAHVITSTVEHPAVSEPLKFLHDHGVDVTHAPVSADGRVDRAAVERAIKPRTVLLTVMHANNETGALNDVAAIAELVAGHEARVHTDAAQSVGKVPVDVKALDVDLLTIAGHKLYAPKGVGALYVRRGVPLTPLIHGAAHESGRRAGTESALLAAGLGAACKLARAKLDDERARVQGLRDKLHGALRARLGDKLVLNGPEEARLPNTLNVSFVGAEGSALLAGAAEIAASTGSACHEGEVSISPVLAAMGVPRDVAEGAVRLSLGRGTGDADVEAAASALLRAYEALTQ